MTTQEREIERLEIELETTLWNYADTKYTIYLQRAEKIRQELDAEYRLEV